nr:DNA polymerase-like [Ziziphus jujuba var. spinosa]
MGLRPKFKNVISLIQHRVPPPDIERSVADVRSEETRLAPLYWVGCWGSILYYARYLLAPPYAYNIRGYLLCSGASKNMTGSCERLYGVSEDYRVVSPEFEERSNRMLFDFLERLAVVSSEKHIRTVYFHNFSRFDGLLILKYLTKGNVFTFKPLMRNHRLYDLTVYREKKQVYRLRDSITLLPGSLSTLATTLCPELGSKGSVQHETLLVGDLIHQKEQLLDYLKQDIRLLGGVMLKAQEIYWTQFQVDIEDCMTLSALAMIIFRTNYYDPNSFPIHIPSRNEDTFIWHGYYGGHADTYKSYGENLFYYDVNSLYPYIMKTYPMPGGVPIWNAKLENRELFDLYGFVKAYVVCPETITRLFLTYKGDKNPTLLFPTGKFLGVHLNYELIFTGNLGYKIYPIRGYLFEKTPSPFVNFVSSLYEKRKKAKKTGKDAMAYGYKILMNSLYGRFGINLVCTITEICNKIDMKIR